LFILTLLIVARVPELVSLFDGGPRRLLARRIKMGDNPAFSS
jgi:hypothetical protein